MRGRCHIFISCALLGAYSAFFFLLPSLGTGVFLSPDETAAAVSARQFGQHGTMRFTMLSRFDEKMGAAIIARYPWLHPRSFVSQDSAIVPVGFLGLPILLGAIWRGFGEWGIVFFTPLLALSAVYPLWRLSRSFGTLGQIVTIATWLTFPSVIYYANRGLFPNLPTVCFALWAVYFLCSSRGSWMRRLISGLCVGFTLMIRPIEIVWIAPWLWVAWRYISRSQDSSAKLAGQVAKNSARSHDGGTPCGSIDFRQSNEHFCHSALDAESISSNIRMESSSQTENDRRKPVHANIKTWLFFVGCVTVGVFTSLVALKTYGSPFRIGYFLRDASATGNLSLFPFGFHPRNILFNVYSYVVGFLGPWFVLAIFACVVRWKDRSARPVVLLGAWTMAVLLLLYGEGIYQDHVGVNVVSSGNSFLRYILPLAPFFALAAGSIVRWLQEKLTFTWAQAASCALAVLLVVLGTWTSLRRDDEGLLFAMKELQTYQRIRQIAIHQLDPYAIILSERSDKIFFPTFRSVSPLPPMQDVSSLVTHTSETVALFASTFDEKHHTLWQVAGIKLHPVFTIDATRQTMYVVSYGPEK